MGTKKVAIFGRTSARYSLAQERRKTEFSDPIPPTT
jgi:hypothetical protein